MKMMVSTIGFVSMALLSLSSSLAQQSTTASVPEPLVYCLTETSNEYVFHLFTALSNGGTLAIANTPTINTAAQTLVRDANVTANVYIGLTDVLSEGNFIWVDGTPFTFDDFASGRPTGGAANFDDFVALGVNVNLQWIDLFGILIEAPLSPNNLALYQFPAPLLPNIVSNAADLGITACAFVNGTAAFPIDDNPPITPPPPTPTVEPLVYCLSDIQTIFLSHLIMAASNGGTIAVVDTAEINTLVQNLAATTTDDLETPFASAFIGLSDIRNEGTFEWVDGTSFGDFVDWADGQPTESLITGRLFNCVILDSVFGFQWNDVSCNIGGIAGRGINNAIYQFPASALSNIASAADELGISTCVAADGTLAFPLDPPPPPMETTTCCTVNFGECLDESFCNTDQTLCEVNCLGIFAPLDLTTNCIARWEECNTASDCCEGLTCVRFDVNPTWVACGLAGTDGMPL